MEKVNKRIIFMLIGGIDMETTVTELWERTLNNCKFYEEKKDNKHLLNEIGVLRGITYVLELTGSCPHTEEFFHFIEIQNELMND